MARPTDDTAKWYILAQLAQAVSAESEANAQAEVARKVRDDAIRRAKNQGISYRELATLTGLSKSRIQQVVPDHDEDGELEHAAT